MKAVGTPEHAPPERLLRVTNEIMWRLADHTSDRYADISLLQITASADDPVYLTAEDVTLGFRMREGSHLIGINGLRARLVQWAADGVPRARDFLFSYSPRMEEDAFLCALETVIRTAAAN